MTWGVLNVALNGLISAVPAVNKHFTFDFIVRDYRVDVSWGRGSLNQRTTGLGDEVVAEGQQITSLKRRRLL